MVYRILIALLLFTTSAQAQVVNILANIAASQGRGVVDTTVFPPMPPDTTNYTPIAGVNANRHEQNLTASYDSTHYQGFGITYASKERRGFIFRKAQQHIYAPSTISEIYTTDFGATYQHRDIASESGIDLRNYGGGNTKSGKVFLFYQRWAGGSDWLGNRVKMSVDGGQTFTGGTVNLPDPCSTCISSPHGTLQEDEKGNLYQTWYEVDANSHTHSLMWRSTDNGANWQYFSMISDSTEDAMSEFNETEFCYLGGGRGIALIRNDFGETQKYLLVKKTVDTGRTWTRVGRCIDPNGYAMGGISPLMAKKNDSTVVVIASNRIGSNYYGIADLKFGDSACNGLMRSTLNARACMDNNQIDFAYPKLWLFNNVLDFNALLVYYQTSLHWNYDTSTGQHITDIVTYPLFRDSISVLTRTSINYANNDFFYGNNYEGDELSIYGAYQMFIRKAGNYSIDVKADFNNGNTGGTYRTITIEQYTGGTKNATFSVDTQDKFHSAFDISNTGTLSAGQNIQIKFNHDSGTPLTGKVTVTIRKL